MVAMFGRRLRRRNGHGCRWWGMIVFLTIFTCCGSMFTYARESKTTTLSHAIPLDCQKDHDDSIICSFRLPPTDDDIASSSSSLSSIDTSTSIDLTETCVKTDDDEDDDDNNDGNIDKSVLDRQTCLQGRLQVTTASHSRPNINDNYYYHHHYQQEETSSSSSYHTSSYRTLVVGKATYRPPYKQHGPRVARVLLDAPSMTSNDDYDWADWYVELGNAHYPTIQDNPADDEVWIQVELAMNAYREAISSISEKKKNSNTNHEDVEDVSFLGSVYYYLGDAYFLDPHGRHMKEALEAYQQSRTYYQRAIQSSNPANDDDDDNIQLWETKFAEASSKVGMALMASMDAQDMMGDDNDPWEQTTTTMMGTTRSRRGGYATDGNTKLRQAQQSFELAISYFEKHLQNPTQQQSIPAWERRELELGYGQALQQLAMIFGMQGKLQQSKKFYETVLELHRDILLPKLPSYDAMNTRTAIADIYLSLSDICTQLGDYLCAKNSYQQAMECHERYGIEVAPIMSMNMVMEDADVDEVLDGYGPDGMVADLDMVIEDTLDALREYRAGITGGGGGGGGGRRPRDELDGPKEDYNDYYYAKDDGYEGDLLASLGTMYLSKGGEQDGSTERAIGFLEQAVSKYESTTDDRESPAMADLLINLAMAYYRNYQFQQSTKMQWKALDLYRSLYGDGVNPYMQAMESSLSMMDDTTNEMAHQQLMSMMMRRKSKDDDGDEESSTYDTSMTSTKASQNHHHHHSPPSKEDIEKKIDLDSYHQSVENATKTWAQPQEDTNNNNNEL